jgi:vitamin B12 transporter
MIRPTSPAALAALTGAALAAATPAALQAQEAGDTVRIDGVVVTATRVPVPRDAVSAAVTVIPGEALRARGVALVLDALREVAGLQVVQSGSWGATTSLILRGGETDYVKVLVDGVPLNEPGGRADLANLSTDAIERIEVVRGPASVLYGSDAVAGVVQIFTKEGRGEPRGSAGIRGGTYGSLGYDVALSGEAGPASYAFSAARFTSDGVYEYNNEYRNTTLSGRVRVAPDARTEATLSVRYAGSEFHYPTDSGGQVVDRNAFQLEDRTTIALDLGRFLTDRLEARVLLTSGVTDAGADDRPDGPADTLGFYGYRSQDDLRRRGIDARANLHLAEGTVLTAGFDFQDQRQRSSNESLSEWGPSHGSFEASRQNHGYYAQALVDLGGRASLTVGARLDDNEAFGEFWTYRAGLAYRLPTGTRLRAAVGTAFKEPSFPENYGAGFANGNPDLDPERSRSWEVGLEQSLLGGRIRLAGTYFDQRFRDMIQYREVPWGSPEPNYVNIASADAAGLELEAAVDLAAALTLQASYTRLDSEVRDAGFQSGPDAEFVQGRPLLRRPEHAATARLAYRPSSAGTFDLAAHYVGDREDLDFATFPTRRVTLDGYTRVDLGAELRLLAARGRRPGLTGTLRIENALDEAYEEVLHFPARGRTILIGGRMDFGF